MLIGVVRLRFSDIVCGFGPSLAEGKYGTANTPTHEGNQKVMRPRYAFLPSGESSVCGPHPSDNRRVFRPLAARDDRG